MNEPELFSSGSDIFSKNAKVLFTDDFLSRVKNIIDSPLAHYWKQIQDYILVKFKRQRVIQTNIWCARKGSHFVSFYHSFFPSFIEYKKAPHTFKNEGGFVPEILQGGISIQTKGTPEAFFKKKIDLCLSCSQRISLLEN